MCDTVIAPGNTTVDGVPIFGKNSDREPNEAQHVIRVPRMKYPAGSKLKCTYIEIPQVEQTYEVLLAKPFWMWGAEMGSNEHGVTIGNEAVFTKIPYEKGPGLIGMDFLRLALERAKTAREALTVITSLLEQYGQSGNCGLDHELYYHNSFIIADPTDAWVLETADRHWAAEQVKSVRTISNGITIGNTWDLASADLVTYAIEKGWCKSRDDFHFGRCYSDFVYTTFSYCNDRQCRTTDMLTAQMGKITPETVMASLRDHGENAHAEWSPAFGMFFLNICAHNGAGPIRGGASQTTGSMVSHLAKDTQTHYITATAAPCTSLFKPVWLGGDLPDMGPVPSSIYDEATLFWQHERLHRATLRHYAQAISTYASDRDRLEDNFIMGAQKIRSASASQRAAYSAECFAAAQHAEEAWLQRVLEATQQTRQEPFYSQAWAGHNKAASLPA
jgi:dipeptidase